MAPFVLAEDLAEPMFVTQHEGTYDSKSVLQGEFHYGCPEYIALPPGLEPPIQAAHLESDMTGQSVWNTPSDNISPLDATTGVLWEHKAWANAASTYPQFKKAGKASTYTLTQAKKQTTRCDAATWFTGATPHNGDSNWWKTLSDPLVCALSDFPIAMLPYPPFKLRVVADQPNPYKLVDGKFLALLLIANGSRYACDRDLEVSDIAALDKYIQKCKLGRLRVGQAIKLENKVAAARSEEERQAATQMVDEYKELARSEFSRLRGIQTNRLKKMNMEIPLAHCRSIALPATPSTRVSDDGLSCDSFSGDEIAAV